MSRRESDTALEEQRRRRPEPPPRREAETLAATGRDSLSLDKTGDTDAVLALQRTAGNEKTNRALGVGTAVRPTRAYLAGKGIALPAPSPPAGVAPAAEGAAAPAAGPTGIDLASAARERSTPTVARRPRSAAAPPPPAPPRQNPGAAARPRSLSRTETFAQNLLASQGLGPAIGGISDRIGPSLMRSVMADPGTASTVPWRSLGAQAEQAITNVMLLRQTVTDPPQTDAGVPAGVPDGGGGSHGSDGGGGAPGYDGGGGSGGGSGTGSVNDSSGGTGGGGGSGGGSGTGQRTGPASDSDRDVGSGGGGGGRGSGGGSGPASASSNIDWVGLITGNVGNAVRTGLELTRPVPGLGMWTGLASDALGGVADFLTISDQEAPIIKTFIVIRSILNALNNVIGHLIYVQQLGSDIALMSQIAAVLKPILDVIGLALKEVKILIDLVMIVIDMGLWAAAESQRQKASPEAAEKWKSMADNYAGNVMGDFASLFTDVWDAATADQGHGEVAKAAAMEVKTVWTVLKTWAPKLWTYLQGIWNVWGGTIVGAAGGGNQQQGGSSAPAVARVVAGPQVARLDSPSTADLRKAAAAIIVAELQTAKVAYGIGNVLIDAAVQHWDTQMQLIRKTIPEILGMKDPFILIRDAAAEAINALSTRAGQLENLAVFTTSTKEKAAGLRAGCDSVMAAVDRFTLPNVSIPGADLLLRPIKTAITQAKSMVKVPIESLRTNADEVAEWMGLMAGKAREYVTMARKQSADIAAKLAKCSNFEDIINLMLGKIQEAVGLGTNLRVEDVRQWWRDIGPQIDEAIVWATQLGTDTPPQAPPPQGADGGSNPAEPPRAGDARQSDLKAPPATPQPGRVPEVAKAQTGGPPPPGSPERPAGAGAQQPDGGAGGVPPAPPGPGGDAPPAPAGEPAGAGAA